MGRKIPLLDLGNVVVKVDWAPFLTYLSKQSGRDPESCKVFLHSSLFYDFEFGNIKPEEFVQRMGNIYETEFHPDDFFTAFCDIFPGWVPEMDEVLKKMAEAGPLYCLSNTNEVHIAKAKQLFDLSAFTTIFASNEIKKRKPYPGIYREVARMLEQNPRDFIFFDDLESNIRGAKRAGLEAHVFQSAADIKQYYLEAPASV